MRTRAGFVSNSSSTAFIITNITDKPLTLVDFVLENPTLVDDFKNEFEGDDDELITPFEDPQEVMLRCAVNRLKSNPAEYTYGPGSNLAVFGDEDGDLLGDVFDYMLRNGGSSKSFKWIFEEWRR